MSETSGTSDTYEMYKVAIVDIDGILRGKYVSRRKLESIKKKGMGFCSVVFGWDMDDVCYENVGDGAVTGWHTGYHDMTAQLDLGAHWPLPWEDKELYLLDFDHAVCPRRLLKQIVGKSHGMGLKPMFALEYEWMNFLEDSGGGGDGKMKPMTDGAFGYSLLRITEKQRFCQAILETMEKMHIPVEGLHCETGPGVYEAALEYCPALEMADRAVLFKYAVKVLGKKGGVLASFMAKYDSELAGCGAHLHQSLWRDGKNVFFDGGEGRGMSKLMRHYLAGQLYCLPEILPMYAPNVNSYKRLVDGYWAPTRVGWGYENRTATHRVIGGDESGMRIECRVAGADVNPYLGMAAALASGLYGIEKELELGEEVQGNSYQDNSLERLPDNLLDATRKMEGSAIARELFGAEFVDHFVRTRLWECRQYQKGVTDWERKRYLEIV